MDRAPAMIELVSRPAADLDAVSGLSREPGAGRLEGPPETSQEPLWMWAALIGMNMSSWLQALTGHDKHKGRAHGKRLRRELPCVPARVTSHAGEWTFALSPLAW